MDLESIRSALPEELRDDWELAELHGCLKYGHALFSRGQQFIFFSPRAGVIHVARSARDGRVKLRHVNDLGCSYDELYGVYYVGGDTSCPLCRNHDVEDREEGLTWCPECGCTAPTEAWKDRK